MPRPCFAKDGMAGSGGSRLLAESGHGKNGWTDVGLLCGTDLDGCCRPCYH